MLVATYSYFPFQEVNEWAPERNPAFPLNIFPAPNQGPFDLWLEDNSLTPNP